jgi:hypothetical protein
VLKGAPDITIEELRRGLAQKGLVFGEGTIRRFLVRHDITRKKDRACCFAKLSRPPQAASSDPSASSRPLATVSSTRPIRIHSPSHGPQTQHPRLLRR